MVFSFCLAIPCTANGMSGTCIAKSSCNGRSVAGRCPGPANIQCCISTDTPCVAYGKAGVCQDKSTCTGNTYSGFCPGAANIQCCVKN